MELIMYDVGSESMRAGYACTCGCKPSATYVRDGEIDTHVCCCGTEFALGKDAEQHVSARDGFHLETVEVTAPWGEPVKAAWMVGAGVHPEPSAAAGHGHDHGHQQGHGRELEMATAAGPVIDPVCGMTVDPPTALEKGLHSHHADTDYYFCGKGCKLDFDEDPQRYLDPAYRPSM